MTTDTDTSSRRVPVTVRVLAGARARIHDLAQQHSLPGAKVSESDVIRASLTVAARHAAELDKAIIAIRGEA